MERTTTRDPRSIVTPEAFTVAPELLGMPLAAPARRFWAMMVDLVAIGLITVVTKSFALILGVVAAVFFVRKGFKRTPVPGSAFSRAMRLSVGCLGVWIAIITAASWAAFGVGFGRGGRNAGPDVDAILEESGVSPSLGTLLSGFSAVQDLRGARDADAAARALRAIAERGAALGLGPDEVRDMLTSFVPSDAPWADEADSLIDRTMEAAALGVQGAPRPGESGEGLPSVRTPEVLHRALIAYTAFTRRGVDTTTLAAHDSLAALRRLLLPAFAADTLRSLAERVRTLELRSKRTEARLDATRKALHQAEKKRGLLSSLSQLADDLGFGFGWATLYMTIVLSAGKGQTLGKKLMGIRVARLDGEPITWWVAFERAGGYAAGLFTGLLGFAQVYWDANRQAIHDRIVGTVVLDDRRPRLLAARGRITAGLTQGSRETQRLDRK